MARGERGVMVHVSTPVGQFSSPRAADGYRAHDGRAVMRGVHDGRHPTGRRPRSGGRTGLPSLAGGVAAAPPSEKDLRIVRKRTAVLNDRIAPRPRPATG
ncbi:hypothetical protein J7E88_11610 [Streptomyces sp. ISL-10]|uniref:hypothetical protein n=1 Tax=Streptomyces sp. ISL-10 TaxID=2819172 RepID=UPI001BE566ED|nr:hypothetical protein [Streptomyces sp. ISL-10]MBT2365935.1 hypothetical protein [Streptomyces sp. ISL-10]